MLTDPSLYKIGELAETLNITHRTIRYYDQMGLLPHMKRSKGGMRLFDKDDINIIKKIRHMQKNEYLPLDVIKTRLFKKTSTVQTKIAVVTDSHACLPEKTASHSRLSVAKNAIELDSRPFNKNVIDLWEKAEKKQMFPDLICQASQYKVIYDELAKKNIKTVYSIHANGNAYTSIEAATMASQQVAAYMKVNVIDSGSSYLGLGAFVHTIVDIVDKEANEAEIDLAIKKYSPLIYQIGMSGSMSSLINDTKNLTRNTLINQVSTFYPIYSQRGNNPFHVSQCIPSKEAALTILAESVEQEFLSKGKFVNKLIIGYQYLLSDAKILANKLNAVIPQTNIEVKPLSITASLELGPQSILVGML